MGPPAEDVPLTFVSGPSDPVRLADQPGTWVEAHVAAPTDAVWAVVTDISLPARFSEEFQGATWDAGTGAGAGASFTGHNRHPAIGEWSVTSWVDVFEPGRAFGWCTVDRDDPGSRWRFDLEPDGTGTRLRFSVSIGPGPSGISIAIESMPDKEPRILVRRLAEHHANMLRTVGGLAALAEGRA